MQEYWSGLPFPPLRDLSRGQTHISCTEGGFFTTEPPGKPGKHSFSSVQFSHSVVSDSLQPHELQHARPPCPSPTPGVHPDSRPWLESVMPFSHFILCHPLLLLPSIFPSIRVFFNDSALCIRWPKYWRFSFNISPSNEHSGLISFRMDWLDLDTIYRWNEA